MFHLFLDEVDDGLVVDEVDVLEPDLLVGVHRFLLLKSVPADIKGSSIRSSVYGPDKKARTRARSCGGGGVLMDCLP